MFKTVKQHIFRSPYQSLAAVLVVSLSLFLISVFFLFGLGSKELLLYLEGRPQVSAYLKDESKPQEIELLKAKMESIPGIKNVDYLTKEDALKIYQEQNKDKPLLLEMVTAKVLPASLEISAYDLKSLKNIAEILKKETIVNDIVFPEDIISSLSTWTQTIRKTGIGLAVFLLTVSIITVLIIIGMKISQRKEEIEVLKLLGATKFYIIAPFYLEGIIYGSVSAFISWGLSYLLLLYFSPFLTEFLKGVITFPISLSLMLEELAGILLLGIIIGFFGSFLAISRSAKMVR